MSHPRPPVEDGTRGRDTLEYYVIPLLLAPGIILHELAHYLVCLVLRVPVQRVVLFQFGPRAGYVSHSVPRSYSKRIFIAVAPLLLNTAVGVGLFWKSAQMGVIGAMAATYFGSVAIAGSLPSRVDAESLFPYSRLGYLHPLFYLALPLIAVLVTVDYLRPYGFRAVYTGALTVTAIAHFHGLVSLTAFL